MKGTVKTSPISMLIVLVLFMAPCLWAASGESENADLELIPDELMSGSEPAGVAAPKAEPAAEQEPCRIKLFLNQAFQTNIERSSLAVPLPHSEFVDWDNRTSLDVRAEASITSALSLTVADRVNYFFHEGVDPTEDDFQNDLKEAYLTWNFYRSDYLDLGRVNVKNGVAVGFNPTDYFKKNAVTTRISEDPSVLRENRLGVLMARGQAIWEKGSLTLAIAPEVSRDRDRWWTDSTGGLGLDRTNGSTRFLGKLSLNTFRNLNPELLYLYEDGRSDCGMNLSMAFGDKVVAYGEWSAGQRRNIIGEALQEARNARIIPPNSQAVIPGGTEVRFQNQLAIGFSYTEEIKRTTWFEYHYNEAGLSREDWRRWLDTGALAESLLANPASHLTAEGMLGQLWLIRQWARDAQEPLSRHSLFIRSQWQEAFVTKLDLTGILLLNLSDGSFFIQPLAEYHLSNSLTLGLSLNFFLGLERSEFGSVHQLGNIKAEATWYF